MSILLFLQDSVGPCVEWRGRELEKKGEIALDEDVKVALLAQLQEIQEAEAGQAMFMLIDMVRAGNRNTCKASYRS